MPHSDTAPQIPGFTALSDQIFIQDSPPPPPPASTETNLSHPDTILIFGWGDGLPKHVAKYATGYRALFPHAQQILTLSPIAKAFTSDLEQRAKRMLPIVNALFPTSSSSFSSTTTTTKEEEEEEKSKGGKILVHTMSNTGAVNYASMLHAYQTIYNSPFPHHLLVMDSTPGGTAFWPNLTRWSRAMALGTANFFPWPFICTQALWTIWLIGNGAVEALMGKEPAGTWSSRAVNEGRYEDEGARRLYLYSREDELIGWRDVEEHAAEKRRRMGKGGVDLECFEGSGHVGHMRMFGEKYWGAILGSWERAVGGEKC